MKLCGMRNIECHGRVQWHHVWEYGADGQIDETWAIVGACDFHHKEVDKDPEVKRTFMRISLKIATPENLAKYPKKDWEQIKRSLGI